MKKFLLKLMAFTMALLMLQVQLMANTRSTSTANEDEAISNLDEAEIYASFDEINDLVAYVNENENVTYEDLQMENSSLIANVNSSAALAMNAQEGEEPPMLSAFLWGCIFSWVGVLVVYLTTDSNKEFTGSAWKGCLVHIGCGTLAYVTYIILVVASSSTTSY